MLIGKVEMVDVLLLPDLDVGSELLSVTALMRAGFTVNFAGGQAEVHKNRKTLGVVSSIRNDGRLSYL